jgi:hypothetical protein
MTLRSIKHAAGISMFAAMVAVGASLPVQPSSAQGAVQAVPRAGVAFTNTVTVRAKVESVDVETRTMAFTTQAGRLLSLAVADSVRNLDSVQDDALVDITYNEVVNLLNLRQKGPGSQTARKESAAPTLTDIEAGRFTLTVTAVDLAANKVSVIDGRGGAVQTYSANSIAKQDMLKKIKVGDVVIGITTPLTVTAITPVK